VDSIEAQAARGTAASASVPRHVVHPQRTDTVVALAAATQLTERPLVENGMGRYGLPGSRRRLGTLLSVVSEATTVQG
jgi:hypothetical protein